MVEWRRYGCQRHRQKYLQFLASSHCLGQQSNLSAHNFGRNLIFSVVFIALLNVPVLEIPRKGYIVKNCIQDNLRSFKSKIQLLQRRPLNIWSTIHNQVNHFIFFVCHNLYYICCMINTLFKKERMYGYSKLGLLNTIYLQMALFIYLFCIMRLILILW